ncbi:MAG: DolP-mannose mannosyltransferase [Chloroflexi bacterium]|nr:DolP-mannose mannosyltransferase [Chloroflexota bacterium]
MREKLASTKQWVGERKEYLLFGALFLISGLIFWQLGIDRLPLTPDRSMQVYIAQEILRGQPPYRSVFFPKTPLTAILGSASILIGNTFGLIDLISVRILFLILGCLGVAFLFLVTKAITPNIWARLASALTLMGFGLWATSSAAGPEPKILTMFSGLISLWFLAEKRWLIAGFFSGLSFLTWQPGAIFLTLSWVVPLSTRTPERVKSFLQSVLGSMLPIALLGVYLLSSDALLPALRQTIVSQLFFLAQRQNLLSGGWSLERTILRLLQGGTRILEEELGLVVLGVMGWLGITLETVFSRQRNGKDNVNPWPLLLSGYGWLLFSFLDLQAAPDLIPVLPYLSMGSGWIVLMVIRVLSQLPARGLSKARGGVLSTATIGAIMILLTANAFKGSILPAEEKLLLSLQEQMVEAEQLQAMLGTEGKVQALGDLSLLVLSERQNQTPLIHLGPKHYNLARSEPGGLEKILQEIEESPPRLMIVDRRNWNRSWVQPFLQFAREAGISLRRSSFLVSALGKPLSFNLGDTIRIIGYRMPTPYLPGQDLKLVLFWQSLEPTADDYHIFIHLIDSRGQLWAQDDGQPTQILAQGDDQTTESPYPTSQWIPWEIVRDVHIISLPPDLPPGEYYFRVGMYQFPTGERLPVVGEDGKPIPNREIVMEGIVVE